MNKIRTILFWGLLAVISAGLYAEDAEKHRAGQVSFFFPMGTNGTDSMNYSNSFSLNMVYGMNGGVDGFELGGVGNFNSHDVKGVQISGVSNINMEETRGIQIAGVSNTNFGDTTGLIWSGTLNSVFGDSKGLMASTFNVTTGEMRGLQIGTMNYAAKSRGVQLGVINVAADGEDSLPIGLISIVKGGYFALEASAGDVIYGNVSYKMGVERFYTIFKAGVSLQDGQAVLEEREADQDDMIYSFGLGWGTMIPLSDRNRLAIEASSSKIIANNQWSGEEDTYNSLNKLDINCHVGLGEHLSLFAGPSFNVYLSDASTDENDLPLRYTLYDEVCDSTRIRMWVGGNAGLSFRF